MISTLRGNYLYSDAASVIVECGGVGFRCITTSATLGSLPNVGDELFLYT